MSGLEIANELRGRPDAEADALFRAGVRLFTIGSSGPDFDFGGVERLLGWRDAKNA